MGSFSSHLQAEADSDYFHIRLHHARIWPRANGRSVARTWSRRARPRPTEPYRQRVYRLVADEGRCHREPRLRAPRPAAVVGAWQAEAPLADLDTGRARPDGGLHRFLRRQEPTAPSRARRDAACLTDWGGATYATSEVTVREHEIVSWDRGYDARRPAGLGRGKRRLRLPQGPANLRHSYLIRTAGFSGGSSAGGLRAAPSGS